MQKLGKKFPDHLYNYVLVLLMGTNFW